MVDDFFFLNRLEIQVTQKNHSDFPIMGGEQKSDERLIVQKSTRKDWKYVDGHM